jgi:uncharacterized iron-regulated membrane protein
MRELLLTVHRWMGLVAGIAIFVIALTGCVLIFENDIDRAAHASILKVTPAVERAPLEQVVKNVRAAYPSEPPSGISFPQQPNHAMQVSLKGVSVGVDPYTGRVLGTVDRSKGFARWVHLLHTRFLAGRPGELIVGGFTVVTLLMAVTGVYLWWPRQIWTLKSSRSWRRLNFDLHNVLGWYSAVLLVFMTLSGVMIAYEDQLDPLVLKLNGSTPAAKPAQVASTVIQGADPISPDEAYRAAQAAVPGAFISNMNLPTPGKAVYRMMAKFPEDRTPAGRSRVAVDQYSGAVLDVVSTRTQPVGTKILNLKRSIHTGDVFGWPSQALAFLVSLSLAGQVVTGILIWWKPGKFAALAGDKSTQRGTARSARSTPSPA